MAIRDHVVHSSITILFQILNRLKHMYNRKKQDAVVVNEIKCKIELIQVMMFIENRLLVYQEGQRYNHYSIVVIDLYFQKKSIINNNNILV